MGAGTFQPVGPDGLENQRSVRRFRSGEYGEISTVAGDIGHDRQDRLRVWIEIDQHHIDGKLTDGGCEKRRLLDLGDDLHAVHVHEHCAQLGTELLVTVQDYELEIPPH